MHGKRFHYVITLISWLSIFCFSSMAMASFVPPARFSGNVLASDYTVGQADFMLPVDGDESHSLYVDPNIAYGSDNQGYIDVGMGYRWIQNKAAILGTYLFGGYSRIANNARIVVINRY